MRKKRMFINTLINSGGKFLSFLLQLVIITVIIKSMGKEAYGILALSLALAANTNLLEAGFGLSVTKYVAEYHASGRWDDLLRIVNTNFLVSTVLALAFSGVLLVVNELFLERIFTIPAALVADAKVLVRLLLCLSITEFWSTSIMRVAEGFQQYLLVRTLEFGKWLLRAGLVVTAVMGGWGLPGIGVAYLVAGIIMLVLSYGKVFSQNSGIRINAKYLDRGSFRQLFGFSIWIFLAKMFSFLSYKIDTIILGIFLPPTNIALYNIAFKVYEFLRFGFSLLSSTLVAVTAELGVLQERETMSRLYQKATKYTMLIMYPIMVFAYFHADLIIRFWMGEGYETSIILAKLFIISLLFVASISAGAEMMVGLNRVRDLVPTAGIASIINVIVSIALVREIGASGVVVGTVIGSFLMSLGYVHQMNKAFGTSMAVIWKGAISTPLSVLLSLVLVFVIVRPLMLADGVFVIASLCIFLFLFDKDDQLLLLAPFRSVIRKISDQ